MDRNSLNVRIIKKKTFLVKKKKFQRILQKFSYYEKYKVNYVIHVFEFTNQSCVLFKCEQLTSCAN